MVNFTPVIPLASPQGFRTNGIHKENLPCKFTSLDSCCFSLAALSRRNDGLMEGTRHG